MPELVSTESFIERVKSLGPDDVARHSMIYPGVYPSDRETHDIVRNGGTWEINNTFWDAAAVAIENGARIEWLRTLPYAGEYGCDHNDVITMRRVMGIIAARGVHVRTVRYSDHAPRIMENCGNDSPIVQDVRAGLERGDPRKSSWALFKRTSGRLVISYLETMDYLDGEFIGRTQHLPDDKPVNPDTAKWTFGWRDAYDRFGEPVSPPSF